MYKYDRWPQKQFNHGFQCFTRHHHPKMKESFIHMAHLSSNRACAQDGYLKHHHPTIIDGDMRWDSGWFFGWFGGRRTLDLQLARQKLGKKHTPMMAAAIALWPPLCPPLGTAAYNN